MKLFGVTGGIGMGKSTFAAYLLSLGLPVVDSDGLAHALVEPGQPALQEIRDAFGDGVFQSDGRLNRAALGEIVFRDVNQRRILEGILHPRIRIAWRLEADRWRAAGNAVGAVIIPLLYETSAQREFESVICLACSPGEQGRRLAARGLSAEQVQSRNAAQMPIEQKMRMADFVIWNEGPVPLLEEQARRVLQDEGLGRPNPGIKVQVPAGQPLALRPG